MYIVITEPLGKLLLRSAPTSALRPSATSACSLQLLVYEEVTSALPHRLLRSFGFLAALARHNFSVTTLSPLAIPPFCIPWKIKKYIFFLSKAALREPDSFCDGTRFSRLRKTSKMKNPDFCVYVCACLWCVCVGGGTYVWVCVYTHTHTLLCKLKNVGSRWNLYMHVLPWVVLKVYLPAARFSQSLGFCLVVYFQNFVCLFATASKKAKAEGKKCHAKTIMNTIAFCGLFFVFFLLIFFSLFGL